jgi:hypothetical protein
MAFRNFANAPKNVATNYFLLENLEGGLALEIRHSSLNVENFNLLKSTGYVVHQQV